MDPRLFFVAVISLAWCLPAQTHERFMCHHTLPVGYEGVCTSTRSRPECESYIDSPTSPLRVHHDEGEEEMAELVLMHANLAWEQQVGEWGWDAVGGDEGQGGNDSLDIYIEPAGDAAGYYQCETQFSEGDYFRCTGFVVIDEELGLDDAPSTMAHELNHVLHRWVDAAEDRQFVEASAVLAEEWYDEETASGWYNAAYYQEGYYRSLDYYETLEPAQYGSFIFLQYLTERLGDGTPRIAVELWEDSAQTDALNSNNWMEALERWLEPRWDGPAPVGDELYTELAWQEFAEWRYFLGDNDDGEHFEHGYHNATSLSLELPNITTADFSLLLEGPLERELRHDMAELSSGTIPIGGPEVGAEVTVEFTADGGEDRWALTLLSLHANGTVVERTLGAIDAGAATVTTVVPEDTLDMVAVLACMGDGDLDPNEDDWDGTSGVLIFSTDAQAEPSDDDDDDSADADEGGCECAAAPGTAPGAWFAMAALVGAWIARRR
jgi:MYXO-CTERM domain-containing protein